MNEVLDQVMTVVIEAIGPHGVLSQGHWFKVEPNLKSAFQKGRSYSVKTTVGPKGGKEILGIESVLTTPPVLDPNLNKASSEPTKPSYTRRPYSKPDDKDKMTKEEWAAKDKRIGRAGILQAAIVAVSPHVAKKEDILPAAIVLSEGGLEWINKSPTL